MRVFRLLFRAFSSAFRTFRFLLCAGFPAFCICFLLFAPEILFSTVCYGGILAVLCPKPVANSVTISQFLHRFCGYVPPFSGTRTILSAPVRRRLFLLRRTFAPPIPLALSHLSATDSPYSTALFPPRFYPKFTLPFSRPSGFWARKRKRACPFRAISLRR